MATPTFDDEKQRTQGDHDNLGVHPERAEAEKASLEHLYNAPSAKSHYDDEDAGLTSDNLAGREEAGYDGGAGETSAQKKEKSKLGMAAFGAGDALKEKAGNAVDGLSDGKKAALFGGLGALKEKAGNKIDGMSKGKKAALFGVGLGGAGLAILIPLMILLFATLAIPNLGEHIASWQFARTARVFRQSLAQINAEKIAIDSASDQDYGRIKTYYENARTATWGKLDKWRPERTYKNMYAEGIIQYKYSDRNLLGRQRIEAIVVNGTEIPIDQPTIGQRLKNRVNPLTPKEDVILAGRIKTNLDEAMKGYNTLVRSSVAKKIHADLGIQLHWWDKQGENYRGKTPEEADIQHLRESNERIGTKSTDPSIVSNIEDATNEAEAAQEACIADDECVKQLLEPHPDNPTDPAEIIDAKLNGEYSPSTLLASAAEDAIDNKLGDVATRVAENASLAAQIAMFACTIYDGSVERSGGSVDATSAAAQKAFYAVKSGGQQQLAGDTTGEAVGAMVRKLGDYSNSIPEKRARNQGKPVSTDSAPSPQMSAGGMFGLFAALFPEGGAQADSMVEPVCKFMTDWRVGLAAAAIEIGIAIYTGGGSKGASVPVQTGVRDGFGRVAGAIGQAMFSKQAFRRILGESAATAGLTVVAKMIVLNRMNAVGSGIEREDDFANTADAGGDLAEGELNRKMFYGRPLTQPEVKYSDAADRQYIAEKKGQQGTFERYFALSNPDSLLVNMGVSLSSKVTNKQGIASLVANASSRFSSGLMGSGSLVSSFNPFQKQIALAQDADGSIDTNYQNVQWGWSEDELALIENDPSYFPLENDRILTASGKEQKIQETYGKCYSDSMGTMFENRNIQRDENGRVYPDGGDCAPINLSKDNPNPEFGEYVFRWRLSKRNNNTLDHMTDLQAPTNSESPTAAPAAPGGGLGISEDGFVFPLQTTKSAMTSRDPSKRWCYQAQTNCHHDYNAADIMADTGTPVVAARGGKVIFGHNRPEGGTGSSIAIMGDDKNVYWYGHLKSGSVLFSGGETVTAGQKIGEVGTDADAQGTPAHLHIDVQPPPATTREGCINQACNQPPFKFLDIQPALIKAFEKLPD